jgi:hypothetical protein
MGSAEDRQENDRDLDSRQEDDQPPVPSHLAA